tara:strand:- start:590 stop:697 length:108 start_codon:yes stop_codon:yes gene_type:complete
MVKKLGMTTLQIALIIGIKGAVTVETTVVTVVVMQ